MVRNREKNDIDFVPYTQHLIRACYAQVPTHLAIQTSKKVAVSRDWGDCRLECLISSLAHI